MKIDSVFEGGGILGISFVGAYKALEEKNYEIVRAAGTSAGSIIATLIVAGYSPNEMIKILETTDFKQFMDKTKITKTFLIGKPLSIIFNNGIYKGEMIEKWIEELLQRKGIKTFADVMEYGESKLKIIVADITSRQMLILPDDLPKFNIDPHTFSIARAVRMSCTIPFFFTPVKLKINGQDHYIVDGGLLSIYPIWIFDLDGKPIRPTIGFKIKDEESLTSKGKHNVIAFTKDLINAPINQNEMNFVRDKDVIRTIVIDNDGKIKSTDFNLKKKSMDYLFDCGYDSTLDFLKEDQFIRYLNKFNH